MANVRPLTDTLAKIAQTKVNEDPKRIRESINLLREWILMQPHIKSRTDDQFLLSFLRGCKHSMERTKQKLDLFYTVRTALPDIFLSRDVSNPRTFELLKLGACVEICPEDCGDGPSITLLRLGAFDPHKYHCREIIPMITLITDLKLKEMDIFMINGGIMMLDLDKVTAAHLLQLEPLLIKKVVMIYQDSAPFRNCGVHILNAPKGIDKIINLIRSFLNEKNKSRFYVHSQNSQTIFDYVPKKMFPKEYGGESRSITEILHYWEDKIRANEKFFEEEKSYGTIETLRPGKLQNAQTLFGSDGTFRKLELD